MKTLSKERYLVQSEIEKLFSTLEKKKSAELAQLRAPRWVICYYALSVTYHLGLRVSEVKNIKLAEIDLQSEYPSVHIRQSKFKKSRYVPLPKKLQVLLRQYITLKQSWGQGTAPDDYLFQSRRGKCYSIGGLESMFLSAIEEAQLPRRTIHSLRHSFGFAYYGKHTDIRGLSALLGHADISTTQVYCSVPFDVLSQRVNEL